MAVLSKTFLGQRPSTTNLKSAVDNLTTLYLQNRTRISRAVYLTLFIALINRVRNAIAEQKAAAQGRNTKRSSSLKTTLGDGGRKKVELNREFFKNLLRLLKICIPGWKSKELRLIISHSIFLVLRTMISTRKRQGEGLYEGLGVVDVCCCSGDFYKLDGKSKYVQPGCHVQGDMSRKELTRTALLPPMQAVITVPNTIDEPHPQQVPLANDLLHTLRS
jgi:hypothetical protein